MSMKILKAITPPIIIDYYKKLNEWSECKKACIPTYRLSSGDIYWSGKGVGEMWEEIGRLQFEYLVKNGLLPRHTFLDIGCGSLRGGIKFINYLENGNYYGIEKESLLLKAAIEVEIPRYGLLEKKISLENRDDFDFSVFNTQFDFALAQSVFTHLTWNKILKCLVNLSKVLKTDGVCFATFFEDKDGSYKVKPMIHTYPGGKGTSYPDEDPYHYEFDFFVELAKRTSLKVEYIGEWNHPRGQMMMVFKK